MPLYDFECGKGHGFERFVPLAEFKIPQQCGCGGVAKRVVSAPRILSDYIAPTLGPDGKMHDSMASYAASCKPEGNPQRKNYEILGDTPTQEFKPPKVDKKKRRDDIRSALADVKKGKFA